jgi:hypothetical protein
MNSQAFETGGWQLAMAASFWQLGDESLIGILYLKIMRIIFQLLNIYLLGSSTIYFSEIKPIASCQ